MPRMRLNINYLAVYASTSNNALIYQFLSKFGSLWPTNVMSASHLTQAGRQSQPLGLRTYADGVVLGISVDLN